MIVSCVQCGREVDLPVVAGGGTVKVSIEPLDGWTAPPPRCPECSGGNDHAPEVLKRGSA